MDGATLAAWATLGFGAMVQIGLLVWLMSKLRTEVTNFKESITEIKDDIKEINEKRGEQWDEITDLKAGVAVIKERCRLNGCMNITGLHPDASG